MTLPFTPRLPPLAHQLEFLERDGRRAAWGLIHDPGTGKSKSLVDDIALLSIEDGVDGVLILAPNSVHLNWAIDDPAAPGELLKHWPLDAPTVDVMAWEGPRSTTRAHQRRWERLMSPHNPARVRVLCMSYDSLMTEGGKQASWELLRTRRCVYVADESQRFKTPDAKRTKRVIASSVYAPYRRIASGTPMDKPFDVYAQVRFLDNVFWQRELGLGTFTAFKAHFGVWVDQPAPGGRRFAQCVGYRNLDQLREVLARISSRVAKEDVLDLPPKVYTRKVHPLSAPQRQAYDDLRGEAMAWLETGELVTAEMALVLQLRLAQVGCGFVTPRAGAEPVPFRENPRADLLAELLTDRRRPTVIWGRFRHDCVVAAEASRRAGRRPAVFDGARPREALDAFHAGEVDDLIANLESGMREGHTLTEADCAVYYSNSPKLLNRVQSEDRIHRISQVRTCEYVDLLGERTDDARTLDALVAKRGAAGAVLGDDQERLRAWLRDVAEG